MPQSLVQNYQHVVFSTKNREPFLGDPTLRADMHAYLGGICRSLDSPALVIGGVADHVHILCRLSKGVRIEDFLRELKRDSSRWAKTRPAARLFRWQGGGPFR